MNKKQLIVAWFLLLSTLGNMYVLADNKATPEPNEWGGDLVVVDSEHPIDAALSECWKDTGVTAELVDCLKEAYAKWEAEMDKYYVLLIGVLDKDSKKRLERSQKAWIKFRDSSFEFIPLYFQDIGSYQRPTIWCDKVRIIRVRALDLKRYYLVIKAGQ